MSDDAMDNLPVVGDRVWIGGRIHWVLSVVHGLGGPHVRVTRCEVPACECAGGLLSVSLLSAAVPTREDT